MGELENKSKKRRRRRNVQKVILYSIAGAGVLAVGLVAPNVIGAMAKLGILPNPREQFIISSATSRMRRRGYIKLKDNHYELTPKGKSLLQRWEFADFNLKRPKKWDGQWRVVIFDIPEKLKSVRDRVRRLLNQAHFIRLQDSVWVYPYDCEEIISLLKTDLGIRRHVLYLIADQIENDKYLKEEFKLS